MEVSLFETLRECCRAQPIELAILFGSMARGRASASSDLDLAVRGEVDVLGLIADASAATGRPVDVVRLERASTALLVEVMRDGIIVYERMKGDAAAFMTSTWITLSLDLPAHERMESAWLASVAKRGLLGRP